MDGWGTLLWRTHWLRSWGVSDWNLGWVADLATL